MSATVHKHASVCATLRCASTPDYAAIAMNCTRDAAATALREAAGAGLFRRLLLPGLGNAPVYQPTAKAGAVDSRNAPKFLRAGLSEAGRWRGLLRGGVVFSMGQNLDWLSAEAQSELHAQHAIPAIGHAGALVASDTHGRYRIVVPVPPADATKSPKARKAAIESAAMRWLPLLEQGSAELHFVTRAGLAADVLQTELSALLSGETGGDSSELAELDARIAADKTGLARVQLASRRAELAAAVAAAATQPAGAFPWHALAGNVLQVSV